MAIATTVRRPDLLLPSWKPEVAPAMADPDTDMFALIRSGDVLGNAGLRRVLAFCSAGEGAFLADGDDGADLP